MKILYLNYLNYQLIFHLAMGIHTFMMPLDL